jgi:hypothetical protein
VSLKSVLESIDDLSEDLQKAYKQQKVGDKEVYVLDIEGFESHPGAKGLKATLDKTKKDLKELKTKFDENEAVLKALPEGFSNEEWDRLKAIDEHNENPDLKKLKETYDSQLATLKSTHKNELAKQKTEFDAALTAKDLVINQSRIARADDHVDVEMTQQLVKAGIRPELMNAAKALHKTKFKHEFENDGTFRSFRETDTGEQSVEEFVSSWMGTEEGKAFIAPAAGGGAAGGNRGGNVATGDNPFTSGAWNKTAQAQLFKGDRVKAERLAKAAGFANLSVAISASSAIGQSEGAKH